MRREQSGRSAWTTAVRYAVGRARWRMPGWCLGVIMVGLVAARASAQDVTVSATLPQTVGEQRAVHVAPAQGNAPQSFDVRLTMNSDILSVDAVASDAPGC